MSPELEDDGGRDVWYCSCGAVRARLRPPGTGEAPRCSAKIHLSEPRASYPFMRAGRIVPVGEFEPEVRT